MRYLLFSRLPRLSTALYWLQFRACTVDGNQSNEKPTELFAFTRRRGRERQTTTYGTADFNSMCVSVHKYGNRRNHEGRNKHRSDVFLFSGSCFTRPPACRTRLLPAAASFPHWAFIVTRNLTHRVP